MIQEQRVILKSVGYGEEGSYNDNVAKYHSQGTAWWPITATHHSQGTAKAVPAGICITKAMKRPLAAL